MTIAFVAIGANATCGANSNASVPYPASIAAGQLLVYYAYTTRSSGTPAVAPVSLSPGTWTVRGQGDVSTAKAHLSVFTAVATGSESGTMTASMNNNSAISESYMASYSNDSGTWTISSAYVGSPFASTTSVSLSAATDPGLAAADLLLAAGVTNLLNSPSTWSAEVLTATGTTIGSVSERVGSQPVFLEVLDAAVLSGTSSAQPNLSATLSPTNQGNVIFMGIRDPSPTPPGSSFDPMGMQGMFGI